MWKVYCLKEHLEWKDWGGSEYWFEMFTGSRQECLDQLVYYMDISDSVAFKIEKKQ